MKTRREILPKKKANWGVDFVIRKNSWLNFFFAKYEVALPSYHFWSLALILLTKGSSKRVACLPTGLENWWKLGTLFFQLINFLFELGSKKQFFDWFSDDRFNWFFKMAFGEIEKSEKNWSLKHTALKYKNEH